VPYYNCGQCAHNFNGETEMVDFKMDVKDLGNVLVLGISLIIVIAILMAFIGPLLATIFPTIFVAKLTLTEVLLFLILLRLHVK
jgi:hypothetical protein